MATLTEFRRLVADAITAAGLPAYRNTPERLNLPAALVLPDQPYVTPEGATGCGAWGIRARVVVVGAAGTNDVAADALDGHIETVLGVLDGFDNVTVSAVNEPVQVPLSGGTYLGVVLNIESTQQIGA